MEMGGFQNKPVLPCLFGALNVACSLTIVGKISLYGKQGYNERIDARR